MVGPLMVFTIKFKRFFIHESSILGPKAFVNKILKFFAAVELESLIGFDGFALALKLDVKVEQGAVVIGPASGHLAVGTTVRIGGVGL